MRTNKEERYIPYPDYQIPVTELYGDMQAAKGIKIDSSHISVTLL